MQVVACAAPIGAVEPAPLTSLPLAATLGKAELRAFWGSNDEYFVHAAAADSAAEGAWYRIDVAPVVVESTLEERMAIAALMADITPIGGGKVAFPIGSTGRRFYRVWRTGTSAKSRTRILEVRAARSRRRPA